jgi:hypothetical protein
MNSGIFLSCFNPTSKERRGTQEEKRKQEEKIKKEDTFQGSFYRTSIRIGLYGRLMSGILYKV